MHQPSHRIPSLDGLRAISVLLVVFSHLLWGPDFLAVRAVYARWFAPLGDLGVRVFFVISGFLITSLLLRELERHNRIDLVKFYFRRTLRIFPPYYFLVLSILAVQIIGWIQLPPGDLLHALTYTVNYNAERSMYLGHAWSLSVEEQFYLLWPAVLLIAGRRRGLFIALSVMVLCPLIRLGIWYFFPSLVRYEIGYRFETVADSIAAGCILAGTFEWLKRQPLYHRLLRSKLFIFIPVIIYCACVLPRGSRSNLLFGYTIQNIGIACCIVWAMENCAGRIGTLLNSKPLSFIGVMSYSIYLWQQPFLIPSEASVTSRFPLNVLLIASASLVSYFCIERPSLSLRQWLEASLFSRRRKPAILDRISTLADGNTPLASTSPSPALLPTDADRPA